MAWTNPVKEKLRRGEAAIGCWLTCPSPITAEIIASAGFDWVLIDMEHGPITVERAAEMAIACRGTAATPIARVPLNRPEYVKQALDTGVWGVLVPMVNCAEEARQAVAAAHYPPFGIRGRASGRNCLTTGLKLIDYCRQSREQILVGVQIETPEAVEKTHEIAATEGLDLVFIGPTDLAHFMGVEAGAPALEAAIASVLESCQRRRKPAGIFALSLEEGRQRLRQGFQFVNYSSDMSYLNSTAQNVARELRAAL